VSLNVSSNRLDSLDATSVRWLKHAAADTDLSGNPWKCECSALGEAWRELGHKLTLICASPELRLGRTWEVLGTFCPDTIMPVEPTGSEKPSMSSDANPTVTTDTGTSLSTASITLLGVTFGICVIGVICCIVVKQPWKPRERSEIPEGYGESHSLFGAGSSQRVSSRQSLGSSKETSLCNNLLL